jgi:O-antigen ligase/polysaccharide polymerase Wzy-like membrane protein
MNILFLVILLVVVAGCYVTYFGLIAKPDWSIYAYLVIWMTVPKSFRLYYITAGIYDFPEGVTVFHVIEAIAICGIGVALIKHRRKTQTDGTEWLRRFSWLFLIAGTISFFISLGILSSIFPTYLDELWNYLSLHSDLQYRVLGFAFVLYSGIFLYGCIAFITELRQVERILTFFLGLGIIMSLESIVFYYLVSIPGFNLFPSIAAYSVHQASNRFMSIVFTNFDQVGLFLIIAVGCCLYFAVSRKRKAILGLLPLLFLPVLAGYQRSVLFGVLVTLGFFYWHHSSGKRRVAYISLIGAAIVTMYILDSDLLILNNLAAELGGTTRADYFSTESLDVRFGLQMRAIELFLYAFPFGVGPGSAPVAMNSPIHQAVLGINFPQVSDYSAAIYGQISTGVRTTNPHNFFVEFLLEHGALGLTVLVGSFFLIFRNFRTWLKSSSIIPQGDNRLFFAQVAIYALLLGVGIHESFESTFFPFTMYMMFLYFTFLLLKLHTNRDKSLNDHRVRKLAT